MQQVLPAIGEAEACGARVAEESISIALGGSGYLASASWEGADLDQGPLKKMSPSCKISKLQQTRRNIVLYALHRLAPLPNSFENSFGRMLRCSDEWIMASRSLRRCSCRRKRRRRSSNRPGCSGPCNSTCSVVEPKGRNDPFATMKEIEQICR